jgi:hypothetical protein
MRALFNLSLWIAILGTTNAFQFMQGWKLPTYDPNAKAAEERFGDKSK